jgi:hypothetical protein
VSDETVFFGPWRITTAGSIPHLGQWQLQFDGTDGQDGVWPLSDGQPITAVVTGQRWALTVLTYFHFPSPGLWAPTPPLRTKRFQASVGLVVDLTASSASDVYPSPQLLLHCVNDSPDVLPIVPGDPPFDFSVPEQ